MLCLRSVVIALALALIGPHTLARANEDSHVAAVLELFEAMDTARMFDVMIDQMMDLQIRGNPALAEQRPIFREYFRKYYNFDSLKGDMIRAYVKAFTEAETRELTAFYKTPAGRKSISVMPKLMSEMGVLGMHRVQAHIPELNQMLAAHEAAKGQSTSSTPAQPPAAATTAKKSTKPAPATTAAPKR